MGFAFVVPTQQKMDAYLDLRAKSNYSPPISASLLTHRVNCSRCTHAIARATINPFILTQLAKPLFTLHFTLHLTVPAARLFRPILFSTIL